jgi:hypothetical protein
LFKQIRMRNIPIRISTRPAEHWICYLTSKLKKGADWRGTWWRALTVLLCM